MPLNTESRGRFSNEDDECNIRDSADPGIADQLRIQRQQSFRLFGVAAVVVFQSIRYSAAIELAEGINVSNELLFPGRVRVIFTCRLSLDGESGRDRPVRISRADAPLMDEAVPGFSFLVFKRSVPESSPFLEEHSGRVSPRK